MKKAHWVTHMKATILTTRNGLIQFGSSSKSEKTACGIRLFYGTLAMKSFRNTDTVTCEKCEAAAAELLARAKKMKQAP